MARRKARELAFILLFEQSFDNCAMNEVIERANEARDIEPDAFALKLAQGTAVHIPELDDMIDRCSANWTRTRLSHVSLSLLRLGIYEMLYVEESPASVAINEAVELAKKYGGSDEAPFINGVLGAVMRRQAVGPNTDAAFEKGAAQ